MALKIFYIINLSRISNDNTNYNAFETSYHPNLHLSRPKYVHSVLFVIHAAASKRHDTVLTDLVTYNRTLERNSGNNAHAPRQVDSTR